MGLRKTDLRCTLLFWQGAGDRKWQRAQDGARSHPFLSTPIPHICKKDYSSAFWLRLTPNKSPHKHLPSGLSVFYYDGSAAEILMVHTVKQQHTLFFFFFLLQALMQGVDNLQRVAPVCLWIFFLSTPVPSHENACTITFPHTWRAQRESDALERPLKAFALREVTLTSLPAGTYGVLRIHGACLSAQWCKRK